MPCSLSIANVGHDPKYLHSILYQLVNELSEKMKTVLILSLFAVCCAIPIPPDQLLSWLVPEMCPTERCPQFEIPVCGTNGMTYTNECFLKVANCSSNDVLVVKYFGNC